MHSHASHEKSHKTTRLATHACRLLTQLDFPSMKFSLLFLGYCPEEDIPKDEGERVSCLESLAAGNPSQ